MDPNKVITYKLKHIRHGLSVEIEEGNEVHTTVITNKNSPAANQWRLAAYCIRKALDANKGFK